MDDAKLAMKHALERFANARGEHEIARRAHEAAVTRSNATFTKQQEAEISLIAAAGVRPSMPPRYIRWGDRLIIITATSVTWGELERDPA